MVTETLVKIGNLAFVPFIDHTTIQERIAVIGAQISHDYEDKDPLFVPILNGAFMFAADLMKEISIPCELSFVKVASYLHEHSTGEVEDLIGIQADIKGRHVVLVEDIVDTGLTMSHLVRKLTAHQPASLAIATLFVKPESLMTQVSIKYTGFEIPNKFIVGYGLDYQGKGRNYRDVYQKAD